MASPAFRLRPMSVSDIMDETINLYRRNLLLFVRVGAVALLPLAILQLLIVPATRITLTQPANSASVMGQFALGLAGGFVGLVVYAAMVVAVSEVCLGRPVTVSSVYAHAFRRFWAMLGLGLLVGMAIVGMTVTIVGIPFMIYFLIGWSLSYQALLVEGEGIRRAMGRSRALVRGRWWRTFGIALLIGLFTSIVGSIFTVPSSMIGFLTLEFQPSGVLLLSLRVLQVAFTTAASLFMTPLTVCCWMLVYFDLRARKEGLDLEIQAGQLETFPPSSGMTQ